MSVIVEGQKAIPQAILVFLMEKLDAADERVIRKISLSFSIKESKVRCTSGPVDQHYDKISNKNISYVQIFFFLESRQRRRAIKDTWSWINMLHLHFWCFLMTDRSPVFIHSHHSPTSVFSPPFPGIMVSTLKFCFGWMCFSSLIIAISSFSLV